MTNGFEKYFIKKKERKSFIKKHYFVSVNYSTKKMQGGLQPAGGTSRPADNPADYCAKRCCARNTSFNYCLAETNLYCNEICRAARDGGGGL